MPIRFPLGLLVLEPDGHRTMKFVKMGHSSAKRSQHGQDTLGATAVKAPRVVAIATVLEKQAGILVIHIFLEACLPHSSKAEGFACPRSLSAPPEPALASSYFDISGMKTAQLIDLV